MPLPPLLPVREIHERLQKIFPAGTANRTYCTREMAAKTVFAMLYIGAVEGAEVWIAPKQIYRLNDKQAFQNSDEERTRYALTSLKPGFRPRSRPWFADNSREPIRDETLREGLMPVGAVVSRQGVPTTSSKGRYALEKSFAQLFDPELKAEALEAAISKWRGSNLSPAALARIAIMQSGAAGSSSSIFVQLPNGERRRLAFGPSSIIVKAVIERFATLFLENPAVVWISESGKKVTYSDQELANRIGLTIDPQLALPDVILVDIAKTGTIIVFIEAVATDGPVSERRREELLKIAASGGFSAHQVRFLSAFEDRNHPALRKVIGSLAWNSCAWCASEPESIIVFYGPQKGIRLAQLPLD